MEKSKVSPPGLFLRFFRWYCHPAVLDYIEGDLMEVYRRGVVNKGKRNADIKFIIDVLLLFRPGIIKPLSGYRQMSNYGVMKSYVIIGWRNIFKNKVYSAINIFGLSMGLACCMLLLLYTKDEVSFDKFHEHQDNLYQLTVNRREANGGGKKFAIAAMVQGPAFKKEIPEIESFTRVRHQTVTVKLAHGIYLEDVVWADDNFFSVFSFPLRSGSPGQALKDLYSVVLTKETALKYFDTIDVLGKGIEIEVDGSFGTFIVSGIAEEAPPNSSIKFNMLLPFNYLEQMHPDNGWHWVSFPTYLTLHKSSNLANVASKMAKIYQTQAAQEIDEMKLMGYGDTFIWGLRPFSSMHLNTEFEGVPEASKPIYSYILSGIALFILIIANINFVNIAIAQSIKRAREIGIRKVIGSQRVQIVQQFLGEATLVCLIAFVLAIGIAQLSLPSFNQLANKNLQLSYLLDWNLIVGTAVLFFSTALFSGFYPALILSRLEPVKSLHRQTLGSRRNYLARGLVVAQFALSTFLIIATLIFYSQFSLLTKTDLGYDDKSLIELTVPKAVLNQSLSRQLKNEFGRVAGADLVASKNVGKFGGSTKANGHELVAVYDRVDEDYVPALRIPIKAGRNFSEAIPADSLNSVLVNETFVKEAGWNDAVGQTIESMNLPGWGSRHVTVVGVVKDYHFESLRERIKPQVFTQESKLPLGKFLVRVSNQNISSTIEQLETALHKKLPNDVFQYQFVEDRNAHQYQSESKWKQMITIASAIAISICCIGLFGITALTIEKRTKEIGVRKILGSTTSQIMMLVSKDFFPLILIGFVVASPLAWKFSSLWLEGFAYRIQMTVWVYALAGALAIGLAALTIGILAIRVVKTNAVESLRHE